MSSRKPASAAVKAPRKNRAPDKYDRRPIDGDLSAAAECILGVLVAEKRPLTPVQIQNAVVLLSENQFTLIPGTVYPTLLKLEGRGLIKRTNQGRDRVYSITPDGRAEIAKAKQRHVVLLDTILAGA